MYARGHVRLGLALGRHPKKNLFVLHYCDFCCEEETKYVNHVKTTTVKGRFPQILQTED